MPKGIFKNPKVRAERISESSRGKLCPWAQNTPQVFKDGHIPWNKGVQQWLATHPSNWKGGTSIGSKRQYYTPEYRNWRRDVFIRDEFTCVRCGKKNVYITAHHILSSAYYPELRFEPYNGLTLCEPCHMATDNYRGRANQRGRLNV